MEVASFIDRQRRSNAVAKERIFVARPRARHHRDVPRRRFEEILAAGVLQG
jgi:hypothetical protein